MKVWMPISTTGRSNKIDQLHGPGTAGLNRFSRPSPGFTLLELVVVIAMISILTALTIPRLPGSLFFDDLKSTSRKLVGIIAETSQEAIRNQRPYLLTIDMEENSIQAAGEEEEVRMEDDAQVPGKRELMLPESVRIFEVSSVYGGRRTMGTTVIRFSQKGYVDKTHIHLRSDEGDEMTVMLSPFLGVVKIADTYVDLDQ